MKKKILCVLVAMLAVALLTIPVMGAPATKIEGVTLTATTTPIPNDMRLVSHDTIRHVRGTSSGPCTLTIPGHPLPEGTWYSEWVTRAKISQNPAENEALIASRVVLTFTGVGTTGTFKGIVQRTIIGGSSFEDNVVLHGTGDFQGWTLKLSYEGTPPVIDEGYLILPK